MSSGKVVSCDEEAEIVALPKGERTLLYESKALVASSAFCISELVCKRQQGFFDSPFVKVASSTF